MNAPGGHLLVFDPPWGFILFAAMFMAWMLLAGILAAVVPSRDSSGKSKKSTDKPQHGYHSGVRDETRKKPKKDKGKP